jgi:hypothetical protein
LATVAKSNGPSGDAADRERLAGRALGQMRAGVQRLSVRVRRRSKSDAKRERLEAFLPGKANDAGALSGASTYIRKARIVCPNRVVLESEGKHSGDGWVALTVFHTARF